MSSSFKFFNVKVVSFFILICFHFAYVTAQQNVSISDNQAVPDPSSVLDVSSTTKGLLIPRMSSVQRLAIVNPTNALMVFDTDSSCILFYQSSVSDWYSMCDYPRTCRSQGDPDAVIFAPNSFTPDNDGLNDTWFPTHSSSIDEDFFEVQIFDRWGEMIFDANDFSKVWDGTYKGRECQVGTYSYRIYYKRKYSEERHAVVGHISLIK